MYCNACKREHCVSEFSARQRRKPASSRVCRKAARKEKRCESYYLTESEMADFLEFGPSRVFVTEYQEARYASDED
jgi:hypothetical protein